MKIAILPGDGIGPEITNQAVGVLKALNVGAELVEAPIGGAGYEKFGDPLPDSTLDLAIIIFEIHCYNEQNSNIFYKLQAFLMNF
jgi:isocitrate/isopropylmalate dehydrogenase